MTQDEIIEMAKEVYGTTATKQEIRFAYLVAAKEREACAKVAEDMDAMVLALLNVTSQPIAIAAAIRARGEQA